MADLAYAQPPADRLWQVQVKKWGYLEAEDTDTCTCGKIQTTHHLLQCGGHCSEMDLAMCTDTAIGTNGKHFMMFINPIVIHVFLVCKETQIYTYI